MPEVDQDVVHNTMAGAIIRGIVRPVLNSGGGPDDVCVLLESVIVGVIMTIVKLGGDKAVTDILFERVRARLAENRLSDVKTEGTG